MSYKAEIAAYRVEIEFPGGCGKRIALCPAGKAEPYRLELWVDAEAVRLGADAALRAAGITAKTFLAEVV